MTAYRDLMMQPPFLQTSSPVVATQGIKYAGSKLKLLPQILEMVDTVQPRTVFDGFAGTTRVAQALAGGGYTVVANDLAVWSKVFATCYLLNDRPRSQYQDLIDYLNNLDGVHGWFSEHYGGDANGGSAVQADGRKRPWQYHVTHKLDAIRTAIDTLNLDDVTRAVALTSLILALDKVDSTIGHYAAYLKAWSPRSHNHLQLKVPRINRPDKPHVVLNQDIFAAIEDVRIDLAYFDPPYGSNNEKMPPSRVRYAAYYHIWKTICLNDRPELFGKVRRRKDSSDTAVLNPFEDFRRCAETDRFVAVEAIEKLIRTVQAEYVLLSYSSGGRATAAELHEILVSQGDLLRVAKVDYKQNVMADMRWTHKWVREAEQPHQEFLFLLRK